jgi:hypothetical protein
MPKTTNHLKMSLILYERKAMSGNELMLALSNEVERSDRYKSPPAISRTGQIDRQHEREHVVAIRDLERDARERVARSAVEAAGDIAWIEGRARVNTEAKFAVDRAHKESEILAQGDPIKQMKFAILDDEFFSQTRVRANKPMPQLGSTIFS